ncbi:hypothetical protein BDP81DRAFT_413586 [Colletotrichum phormii]|uniref:Uncharacterized protein n=1 Tax=Colletotrichum phormii TaxID=359342 RepID=A0AAJ0A6A5_9PEZI|nr:uncharacterized protein BDP81DRAFT_413586 [Colletotrichum phormii]KAK1655856.1 hypothetical protein BDP81DRAFT_413586 [Colletotrichum phormii]
MSQGLVGGDGMLSAQSFGVQLDLSLPVDSSRVISGHSTRHWRDVAQTLLTLAERLKI